MPSAGPVCSLFRNNMEIRYGELSVTIKIAARHPLRNSPVRGLRMSSVEFIAFIC
jgi:hypothetical protein